ncbi:MULTISPECIES: hypothetical protein [unclassified Bradyrhizobium]|uniref:hypothetical protein n=1 Tax=unclassified Bradyrhizobium TaxID=2631580 RepID=UPI0004292009|nr:MULTISPECIES: hypothetical protein [unclassified Bradyrhizobium]MCP3463713.1 hypothetical protein [Bradyrhizobium sp. CCGUVB23]
MADTGKKDSAAPVRRRTGLDAVSAVRMSEDLTAAVDAWAEVHQIARSDAICQLVMLGLKAAGAVPIVHGTITRDHIEIEERAARQLDQLLDPALPAEERERRIRRLTEGPPEFSNERIDLPKRKG